MIAGILVCLGLITVFYNTVRAFPLLLILMPVWLYWWSEEICLKKRQLFERQLAEALRILSAALEAGRSFENAMDAVCLEMEREGLADTMVGREFRRMVKQLSVNRPVEQVWQSFAARCGHRDVVEIAMVISAGKRAGGNLISVMKKTTVQIAEKMEVDREIETVLASKKTELFIMMAMPIGILLYMRLVFGDMLSRLYGNAVGVLVMSLALAVYLAAAFWGRRIIRIEV